MLHEIRIRSRREPLPRVLREKTRTKKKEKGVPERKRAKRALTEL